MSEKTIELEDHLREPLYAHPRRGVDDSATEIFSSVEIAEKFAEKVFTIHRPGYDAAEKPSLITGERILTDKEMRDMAVQLDRAFRICLASRFSSLPVLVNGLTLRRINPNPYNTL